LRDLTILEGTHAANAKSANNDAFDQQGYTAFCRDHSGQGEVNEPSAQYRIFRRLGWALESDRGMGFGDGGLYTAELRIVTALQIEQMPAIIHDGDDDLPLVGKCLRLGCSGYALGVTQCEKGLVGHESVAQRLENPVADIFHAADAGDMQDFGSFQITGV
jgi:hypothetical protein